MKRLLEIPAGPYNLLSRRRLIKKGLRLLNLL